MCQVQDDDFVEKLRPKTTLRSNGCMKCGDEAVVVLRAHDTYCKACFLSYCTHKFRATIGKNKLIKNGERVLLAFSGGESSSSMLNLVKAGLDEKAHKRLRFTPSLVYIDEGVVTDLTAQQRSLNCERIRQKVVQSLGPNSPLYIVSLEQVFSHQSWPPTNQGQAGLAPGTYLPSPEDTSKFREFLSTINSLTAKEDLVNSFREFTAKEVAFYNRLCGVESVALPRLTTATPQNATIGRLTEACVASLQAEYPSTVSTVFRTGEKLCSSSGSEGDDGHPAAATCILCQSPLDTRAPKSSALTSTLFSEKLSLGESGPSSQDQSGQPPTTTRLSGSPATKEEGAMVADLCYGCRVTLRDLTDVSLVAEFVSSEAATSRKLSRKEMEDTIQDCLIQTDDQQDE